MKVKAALVAEIEKRKKEWQYGNSIEAKYKKEECNDILSFLHTLEVKEVDLKQKSFVKIDRKLLFEICDAILEHEGYCDRDDCYDSEYPYCAHPWDEKFRKKVENIRRNS